MIEIPTNTKVDNAVEKAVESIVEELKKYDWAWVDKGINREQAVEICDMFAAKGYHHEIVMNTNQYGEVWFFAMRISKTPIKTERARYSWSEYVR